MEVEQLSAENRQLFVQHNDGTLQLFSWSEKGLESYRSQEDYSFKPENFKWLQAFDEECIENEYYVQTIGIDQEENFYALCEGNEPGYIPKDAFDTSHYCTYLYKMKDDQMNKVQINSDGEQIEFYQSQMLISENGDCIIGSDLGGISQIDLETGQVVKTYSTDEGGKFILKEDKIYVASAANEGIDIYGIQSGQIEDHIEYKDMDEMTSILKGEQGIYLINQKGIVHLADGGKIWEQIMGAEGVSLGLPSLSLENAFYSNGEFIAFLIDKDNKQSIKRYVYSKSTPSKPEIELTAYILEENQTLREVLVGYELAHPEVRINLQKGISDESGVSKEEAIKALNAELLAGGGPDILLLDGLETKDYIQKDLLSDLNELEGMNDILPAVKNTIKDEKGMYAVPLRFTIPCLVGSEEVLKNVEDFEDLAAYKKANKEQQLFSEMLYPATLYQKMAVMESKKWMEEEQFNKEEVGQFLEGIKLLTQNNSENLQDAQQELQCEILDMVFEKANVVYWDVKSVWDLLYMDDAVEKKDGIFKVMQQEGKACFTPSNFVAINENTKNKGLAEEIVSFMIGEDMQKVDTGEGFPIHQKALETWLNGETINHDICMMFGNGEDQAIEANWEKRALLPIFKEVVEELEVPIVSQGTLEEMVF